MEDQETQTPSPSTVPIPVEGMPWQIKWKSTTEVPAQEFVDREMIHQMTVREDLLSSD